MTHRDYLLDTRFGVLLQGDPEELARCAADFGDPRWGLWLGRKSCLPAVPVRPNLFPDLAQAWAYLAERAGFAADTLIERFDRCEELPAEEEGAGAAPLDQPVSFGRREFHARPIRRLAPGELP